MACSHPNLFWIEAHSGTWPRSPSLVVFFSRAGYADTFLFLCEEKAPRTLCGPISQQLDPERPDVNIGMSILSMFSGALSRVDMST